MSELFSVEVERVDAAEVVFRVTTIHPDAGPPREQATFAMNLLLDLWGLLDRGFVSLIEGCRLTPEQAQALARSPAYATRIEALRELALGRKLQCTAAEIRELERLMHAGEPPALRGHMVEGWGGQGGQHHAFLPADPVAFAGAIAPLVLDFGVDEREHQGAYDEWPYGAEDRDHLPRARVWLRLEDPTLLGFVRAGWRFESASYF